MARPTPTTTNLDNLPGKRSTLFNLPAKFESQDPNLWLVKPKVNKNELTEDNWNDWLMVPKSKTEKSEDMKPTLLDPWFKASSSMSWIENDHSSPVWVTKPKSVDAKAKNLMDPWLEKSSEMSWTSSSNETSR